MISVRAIRSRHRHALFLARSRSEAKNLRVRLAFDATFRKSNTMTSMNRPTAAGALNRLSRAQRQSDSRNARTVRGLTLAPVATAMLCGVFFLMAGCVSKRGIPVTLYDMAPYSADTIQVGDVIVVTFPGATNLNFTQPVRVDGFLHLDQSRQIPVLDKTAGAVKTNLLEVYGPEIAVKELNVVVESPGFSVFVSGAVLRPGKIAVNQRVSLLEAIMEAGGYDLNKADLKKVKVVRNEKGIQRVFVINLKKMIDSKYSNGFHLRPSDVVIVPERFVFF